MSKLLVAVFAVFFFKQKTAYEMRISDWSSDVCSSDLDELQAVGRIDRIGKPRACLTAAELAAAEGRAGRPVTAQHDPSAARPAAIGRASGRERVCQYV